MKINRGFNFKGKYRFIKRNSLSGEIISTSPWIKNLIMKSDLHGINLIIRNMASDPTYNCKITSAEIGTGMTAPTNGDANLQTPTLTGILITEANVSSDNVLFSFFITDASLPNGTYHEFALRCGAQLFSRSIMAPAYVKGTNEDTTVEYIITGNNA